MAGKSRSGDRDENVTVSFGAKFARSDQFKIVFREGMALVEAAATYLDGEGRKEARKLRPPHSLAYATESMRLTTRLMQLASWLLLHRAVNEGEMSLAQANKEKTKVKLAAGDPLDENAVKALPKQLQALIERAQKLHDAVRRLDATIHAPVPEDLPTGNPLERQIGLLRAAFERNEH